MKAEFASVSFQQSSRFSGRLSFDDKRCLSPSKSEVGNLMLELMNKMSQMVELKSEVVSPMEILPLLSYD